MGLFDFFRKKTPEELFRKKVRESYADGISEAKKQFCGERMLDGMIVQAALSITRKALLETPHLHALALMHDFDPSPEQIIQEEYLRAYKKYIE